MASHDPQRPNVVFIVSDDQGAWALGAAGNDDIRTPVLDRLAAEGTRFDRFFCASPVCSPARASLLTGQIPSQHGVHDYLAARYVGPDGVDFLAGRTLITDILAAAGYRCGLSGKWHLGANDRASHGLTHWYAHQRGAGLYFAPPMVRDGRLVTEDGYVSTLITDDAIGFLRERAGDADPFWLSLHYTAPHSPWTGNQPPEIVELYADCGFSSVPREPDHPHLRRGADGRAVALEAETDERSALIGYFAAITAMDAEIGRVLELVESLGLSESTLVVFTSDNGFNTGHHGIWGKGNGTYPQNMYDTSVLVPAIFRQPGRIPAGAVIEDLVSAYDVVPTLLEWLGIAHPDPAGLSGSSFASALRGVPSGGREHVVVFDEYGPVRMVRTREWKYVHRYPDGPHELYDLRADPGESTNLQGRVEHAGVEDELRATLENWFAQHVEAAHDGALLPVTGWGQRAPLGEPAFAAGPPQP